MRVKLVLRFTHLEIVKILLKSKGEWNFDRSSFNRVNTMNHPRFLKLLIYIYFRKDILIHTKVKTSTEMRLSTSKRK